MKLEKIIVDNFRNINHAEYEMAKVNVFTGPNMRGKTNTIEAIYWALADYLLDGGSDVQSFKPHGNTKEVVSVELVFDAFTFKKTFYEKWTKTRGSNEVNLTGHETEYFIDNVKYSVGEGKRILLEKLGLSNIKAPNKVDIARSVIDPYYLAQKIAWKDLRTFIIDLVGDVDDMTVLNSNIAFGVIKEDLVKYKFDVTTYSKFLKQQIKINADEVVKNQNIIVGYKDIKDVDAHDLSEAIKLLNSIDEEIASLRTKRNSTTNPMVEKLEKELHELQKQYMESNQADRDELALLNQKINADIETKEQQLASLRDKHRQWTTSLFEKEKKRDMNKFSIENLERSIEQRSHRKSELSEQYLEIDAEEFDTSNAVKACPHCGGVLNENEVTLLKDRFDKSKAERIKKIVDEGTSLKLSIQNDKLQLEELKNQADEWKEIDNISQLLKATDESILNLSNEIKSLRSSLVLEYVSEKTKTLIEQGKKTKEDLAEQKLVKTDGLIDQLIIDKQKERFAPEQVISNHNAYRAIQTKIDEVERTIQTHQDSQMGNERKLMILEEFIKTKLNLLKNNVASVFKDLEFVLVETNIKEGSYNEVCYPLILGKETPFERGSGSERITTGVYIIECVKAKLGIESLPIIFDEIDKLDTNTIATQLVTESQIISTKVDDINYNKVTLVAR